MKKKIIGSILVGSLLLLPISGCQIIQGMLKGISNIGHVVCDNQAIADMVKAAAQIILGNAQSTAEQLKEEINKVNEQLQEGTIQTTEADTVLLTLNPALASANAVIESAYNIIYNIACPNLAMLDALEVKQSVMQAKAAQAHAAYRQMVKRNIQKK